MVPSHALRLQTILRSLTETVIPAIDPEHKVALDQAHIIAGNLRILLDQIGRTGDYQRVELDEYRRLGAALLDRLEDDRGAEDMRVLFRQSIPEGERPLDDLLLRTKHAVDSLVRRGLSSEDEAVRRDCTAHVLDQAGRQLTRERVWFRAAGFELDADALPSLEEVLAAPDMPVDSSQA
jgi:hypothetical protein